ncbi:unnamed protein product [Symbiodinium sp. CCMP2592]|nr:unnamed protein product [Symbiodinium sp. CCMP2592]
MFIPVEAVLGAPKPDFPTVTARVNFPNSVLEQMQKDLEHVVTESGKALSKNDAMHAIVWHKRIEIFGPQVTHDSKHSTIFFPADIRGRYPGIGRNHIGDATSINAVEVEAATVTLEECAQKFHDESRSGASVEYFREQLDFEASRTPESRVHGFFTPAWPTLITTSVRHGAIYEGRFGRQDGQRRSHKLLLRPPLARRHTALQTSKPHRRAKGLGVRQRYANHRPAWPGREGCREVRGVLAEWHSPAFHLDYRSVGFRSTC